ncbi:MAG: lipoprotein [Hydrogenophaga sp.]|nr:lipoprotein [Hydrogenophaga sp.]
MCEVPRILGRLPARARRLGGAALLATGLLLAACGQRGPLYLAPAAPQTTPAAPVPVSPATAPSR